MTNRKLEDKTIVVLGGSSGIGLATVQAAHAEGASVVIASRSPEKLAQAQSQIKGGHERVRTFTVDASDENSVRNLFAQVGPLHHLIITAAVGVLGSVVNTPEAKLRATLDSKIWGAFYAVKYAAPQMQSDEDHSITFLSGLLSWRPATGGAIAGAAGSAIESFARTLAVELAPIRANTVSAGVIDTPMLDGFFGVGAERQKQLDAIAATLPVKRIGTPDDVADAILFLLKNTFTTGTVLRVDGGAVIV